MQFLFGLWNSDVCPFVKTPSWAVIGAQLKEWLLNVIGLGYCWHAGDVWLFILHCRPGSIRASECWDFQSAALQQRTWECWGHLHRCKELGWVPFNKSESWLTGIQRGPSLGGKGWWKSTFDLGSGTLAGNTKLRRLVWRLPQSTVATLVFPVSDPAYT